MTAPPTAGRPTGNAGASLFTPAYRVRHATGDSAAAPRGEQAGYDVPSAGQQGTGYRWSELDQPALSYQQSAYGSGEMASAWDDDPGGGGYSWMSGDSAEGGAWPSFAGQEAGSRRLNAIRGFPPVPDDPLPTYPPGPFAAWNKSAPDRADLDRGSGGRHSADLEAPAGGQRERGTSSRTLSAATITPDEFDTNHSLPAIKDPVLTKERTSGGPGRPAGGGTRSSARGGTERRASPARDRNAPARGGRGTSRASRRSKRQPRLAIGVAVVIIAAVTAILVITSIGKPGSNPGASNRPHTPARSTSPTPTSPPGKWGYIGTRTTDPTPLTLRELYPSSFVAGGVYFHATAMSQGHNCRAALIGGALQAAVKQAGCSQVLRASYVARLDQAMATIGVFNLVSSTAAETAALHMGRSAFVAPLASKNGVTSRLGQGTGLEEAVVKGHYLVLVWAEKIDLTSPGSNYQRAHLTAFMKTIIQLTVNGSLSYRMVEGKPAAPGQGN